METRFRSSFIPKESSENFIQTDSSGGFVGIIAGFILFFSILGVSGLFVYKKINQNSIKDLQAELASLEAGADRKTLNNIILFDKKIKTIDSILSNHVATSEFLKILEENTLQQVVFSNLVYQSSIGGDITVRMEGEAPSYAVIAEQEKVFLENKNVISVEFSNLSLSVDKGAVSFNFKGVFDKNFIFHKNKINITEDKNQNL